MAYYRGQPPPPPSPPVASSASDARYGITTTVVGDDQVYPSDPLLYAKLLTNQFTEFLENDDLTNAMGELGLKARAAVARFTYQSREAVEIVYRTILLNAMRNDSPSYAYPGLLDCIVATYEAGNQRRLFALAGRTMRDRVQRLIAAYHEAFEPVFLNVQERPMVDDGMVVRWISRPTSMENTLFLEHLFDPLHNAASRIETTFRTAQTPGANGQLRDVRTMEFLACLLTYAELINIMRERVRLASRLYSPQRPVVIR